MASGSNKKKTIGLILENVFTDFAGEFIRNVLSGIQQRKDLRLVVVAGRYDGVKDQDEHFHAFHMIYNSAYQLEHRCHFDGLIICLGSMADISQEQIQKRFEDKLKYTPFVFAVTEMKDYVSVNYDNETGIKEALECLINVHGFTRFGMLGGREDNVDSRYRKEIYSRILKEHGIVFSESDYEATDMSVNTKAEAKALLDRNPDVQAIFCVNDSVAMGLYEEMAERRLVPGKDIMVFGFDNTKMSGRTIPTLTSIGADEVTLGKKSLELLLAKMNGEDVKSVRIPTRLYGRESFPYEMYEYSRLEMQNIEPAFIYRMFDDCFYRYRYEHISRESVNLRRLFKEYISKILLALRQRYMSVEDFEECREMISIFFANGALLYTDADKFLKSVGKLHASVNIAQRNNPGGSNEYINRLFTYMRDQAIVALSDNLIQANEEQVYLRQSYQEFMTQITDYVKETDDPMGRFVSHFDKLGLKNAALYLFDEGVVFEKDNDDLFPEYINLRCVTKSGELYVLQPDRQKCLLREMFERVELPQVSGFVTFPIFNKWNIYGFLVCELTPHIATEGEFLADQLGRLICTSQGGRAI